MRSIFLTIIGLLYFSFSFAQNATDAEGNKHGVWIVKYKSGRMKYKGEFDHGKPIGIFVYYNTKGKVEAELTHLGNDSVDAKMYHNNGKLAGEGIYIQKQKNGEWKFFTEDGYLRARENYKNGKKHGISAAYYINGKPSMITTYVDGLETGEHVEYFKDGQIKYKASYIDGNPDGLCVFYYNTGRIKSKGHYRAAVKDGEWLFVSTEGVRTKITYELGKEISRTSDSTNYKPAAKPRY